jgi:methyl-accepting chemotaxis protein
MAAQEAVTLGIDALDADDRTLLGIIDRLDPRHGVPSYKDVKLLCTEIGDYMRLHFRREEGLLEAYRWPGAAEHKREHAKFEANVSDLMAGLDHDNAAALAADLHAKLGQWFAAHIRHSDMRFKEYLTRAVHPGGARRLVNLGGIRIAVLLPAMLALIVLPMLVAGGNLLGRYWQEHRMAAEALSASTTADLMLAAAGHWAVERGGTVSALTAKGDDAAQRLAQVAPRRQAADEAFAQAMVRLAEAGASAQSMAGVRATHERVAALRSEVERQVALPADARDPALTGRWFAAVTALIDETQALRLAAAGTVTSAQAQLAALEDIKHFIWVVSEFAGRERARVSAVINGGRPMTAEQIGELAGYRGRVELAWTRVVAAREAGTLPEAVQAAVATAERQFFGEFQRTREAVYAAGRDGQPYPLSAPDWFGQSTAAIDTVLALGRTAGERSAALAEAVAGRSTVDFALAALGTAAGLAVAVWALAMVRARITTPIRRMTAVMVELARGNTDVNFAAGSRDEIGDLAEAFYDFKASMLRNTHDDLARKLDSDEQLIRKRHIEDLARGFDGAVRQVLHSVSQAVTGLNQAAGTMSDNAEQTNQRTAAVSAATLQASQNVETVSAAGTQLSASIVEITSQVSRTATVAADAVNEAVAVDGRIAALAQAAERIGAVVHLISDIAGQTNLLALNATIEAARAGDAGKGFAVVAGEVKHLATQTARATEDIAAQISAIQSETGAAVTAIRGITRTIGQISELTTAVAGAVEQQSAATAEISRNVEEASRGTAEVANNITGVAQAANETGRMAHEVADAATALIDQSRRLETEVGTFLEAMRCA